MQTRDTFIVVSGDIFGGVSIDNELYIFEMLPAQLSVVYDSVEEDTVKFRNKLKINVIDASFLELGIMIEACSIPT